jgi:Flp pilus assembly pilin Flp
VSSLDRDDGATSVEYALIAAFIAAVVAAAVFGLHSVVADLFRQGSDAFA